MNRWQLRLVARRADAILASSESTRRDLVRLFPHCSDRVHTVPLGVSAYFSRTPDGGELEATRQRLDLPKAFALHVGTLEPRKNLVRLVQAWRIVADATDGRLPLLLAGRKGWMYAELFRTIEELHLQRTVRHIGPVSNQDLHSLYHLAEVLVYPSLYEGFGLPLLEAMASGLPVVAARSSSLPEIAGDAASLVSPYSPEEIACAVVALHLSPDRRAQLAAAGVKQAARFTWERCSERTWG
jgi:glycosyltransferase involved in cell wall biosynthesis